MFGELYVKRLPLQFQFFHRPFHRHRPVLLFGDFSLDIDIDTRYVKKSAPKGVSDDRVGGDEHPRGGDHYSNCFFLFVYFCFKNSASSICHTSGAAAGIDHHFWQSVLKKSFKQLDKMSPHRVFGRPIFLPLPAGVQLKIALAQRSSPNLPTRAAHCHLRRR